MKAQSAALRNRQTIITLLEDNPRKWWAMYLETLGHGGDADTYLALRDLLLDIHPAARAQCIRMAAERKVFFDV